MASWTMNYRQEDREHTFFWQDVDSVPNDDTNDFFGQFIDFDGHTTAAPGSALTSSVDVLSMDNGVPRLPEALLLGDHPSESLGSSTADEFDFLSTSSHVGPTSSAGQDIDPSNLTTFGSDHGAGVASADYHEPDYFGRGSISEIDLPRVEGICLSSPIKERHISMSQPTSPTPPNTVTATAARRTTNKFVEAVQSTIRKATKGRKPKKPVAEISRPGSPEPDAEPMPLKAPRQRPRGRGAAKATQQSPSMQQQQHHHQQHQAHGFSGSQTFVHGVCDDPFNEVPPLPAPETLRYFQQGGVSPPLGSPAIKSEAGSFHTDHSTSQIPPDIPWGHQASSMPNSAGQWHGSSGMVTPNDQAGWWDYNMMTQNGEYIDQKHAADFNMATHHQQAQLPYEYQHQIPDTATSGLMIQMPQPRQIQQPTVVNELTMNAHTQLPPPPPIPQSERPHRPPRAPSSGARHMSCSPVRKNRAPSASPTRNTPNAQQKRHSSGNSVSSTRSASGTRLPASMPGTPCSVRKRRSRDTSSGSAAGSGGLDFGGFVNFTPNDGGMLMTGVAPSGSSKTKARREKEALDRRRKLSEAAIKAVAAAGGDVEQLMQQGFSF